MTLLLSLLSPDVARAAPPPGTIVVSPEAADVPELYLQQQPGASPLHCRPLVDEVVLLCFKVEQDGRRRYVTQADLSAWQTSAEELEVAAAASLTEPPWVAQEVPETGRYFLAQGERAAAVLLHPEWLARVGPEPVVALPARGIVLAWTPGNEELDKVVAVGARKMFEELDHPVSSVIVQRTEDEGWARWGEARPR
jgi:hypothetical protein